MATKAQGVPAFAAHLLDFIGDIEAPHGYDTVYGNNQGKLKKPVTQMTVAEVMAAQAGWSKQFGSSATGRYQFMRDTLRGLVAEQNLDVSAKFDARMQDRLGFVLLRRRGYDGFVAGRIGLQEFARSLAQEWASLPVLAATKGAKRVVARGQSYYAGDGLNKSLVSPERVEAALKVNLPGTVVAPAPVPKPAEAAKPAAPPAKEASKDAAKKGIVALVIAGIAAFFSWIGEHPFITVGATVGVVIGSVFLWRWWKEHQKAAEIRTVGTQAVASALFEPVLTEQPETIKTAVATPVSHRRANKRKPAKKRAPKKAAKKRRA